MPYFSSTDIFDQQFYGHTWSDKQHKPKRRVIDLKSFQEWRVNGDIDSSVGGQMRSSQTTEICCGSQQNQSPGRPGKM